MYKIRQCVPADAKQACHYIGCGPQITGLVVGGIFCRFVRFAAKLSSVHEIFDQSAALVHSGHTDASRYIKGIANVLSDAMFGEMHFARTGFNKTPIDRNVEMEHEFFYITTF